MPQDSIRKISYKYFVAYSKITEMNENFCALNIDEVLKSLRTSKNGLLEQEAEKRLKQYGYNELKEKKKVTPLKILAGQFINFIVWVLFAAAMISAFIGEMLNFWVILCIIGFVVILGFIQEYKAEKAMEALKKIVQPTALVIRGSKTRKILAKEVVPGDLLLLETGDKVSADAKILEKISLKIDESILTGESMPVEKSSGDIIFAGTQIVYGKCKAVAMATGMETKLGKIAGMIQEVEEKTPLQIQITQLAKTLAVIALISCAAIFVLGVFKGAPLFEVLMVALALAVAAVPEGLPLTLTLTLSLGMHRMAKHKAIIRKMLAVEALGSTTMICTDKTGTLTKNEMTAEKIFANNKIIDVSGVGYEPKGEFFTNAKKINPHGNETLTMLLKSAALCNNAHLEEKNGKWEIIGDPTEAALVVLAAKAELWKDDLDEAYQRIEEIIFTAERKLMTTIHEKEDKKIVFVKGAPEIVLQKCGYAEKDGEVRIFNEEDIKNILKVNKDFASQALRVLGVAYRRVSNPLTPEQAEKDLIFLGLIGMIDPPREEVKDALEICKKAGIKVVMITGDNKHTAVAVAKKINLLGEDGFKVLTGEELDRLNEAEFEKIIEDVVIYARTHPEHKLKIVNALKEKGHIVAMTGDGVNDAPALKKADIGIAMGIKGTDVTREASNMVLQDDNFATIVEAIRGGRTIYENIEKFTCYLISRNFTEVILILLGVLLLGFEFLPLLALQILFINAFDEIMPAVALGMDPARPGIMLKSPRKPKQKILTKRNLFFIFSLAAFMAAVAFMVFIAADPAAHVGRARTMVFATIVCTILFIPFAFRSLEESIFKIGFLSNKLLIFAVTAVALLTLGVMYTPFFQRILELTTLGLADWMVCLSAAFSTFIFMEVVKATFQRLRFNP